MRALEMSEGLTRAKISKEIQALAVPESSVDLLKLANPSKNSIHGRWSLRSGVLRSPADHLARIEFSCEPPDEYDLLLVAERAGGTDTLGVGLLMSGRQFMVVMDSYGGEYAGLHYLDGRAARDNETTKKGVIFPPSIPKVVWCSVRSSRITVKVDGEGLIEWKGDPGRLSLGREWWVKNPRALLLGSFAEFRIHKMILFPISGKGVETK